MAAERDYLVGAVFPQTRVAAWSRGTAFQEVDLRWGITREEAECSETIALCLDEVSRAMPFFMAILGGRYGWVDASLAADPERLPAHLRAFSKASATELEIRHAAALHASRGDTSPVAYLREGAEADDERLDALKCALPELGFSCRTYANLAALGDAVQADLMAWLDQFWPEGARVIPAGRAHLKRLAEGRLPRCRLDRRLHRAAGRRRPTLLVGPPGSGKSTALAALLEDASIRRPMIVATAELLPEGAGWRALIAALWEDLGRTSPDSPSDTPLQQVADAMAELGGGAIILDGLDRLIDGIADPDLAWLDVDLPSRVGLIVATAREDVQLELKNQSWQTLEVPPLDRAARAELARTYLAAYGKRLERGELDRVSGSRAVATPLGLRLMLDELRVFGAFETLRLEIDAKTAATDTSEIARDLMRRLHRIFSHLPESIFVRGLPALVLARAGLPEHAVRAFVGGPNGSLAPLKWSPIRAALDAHLGLRAGRLWFPSPALRSAVLAEYLPGEAEQAAVRLCLADYALQHAEPMLASFEAPYQFALAGALDKLDSYLAEPVNRRALYRSVPDELARYTALLTARGHEEAIATARRAAKLGEDPEDLRSAAALLAAAGERFGAEEALLRLSSNGRVSSQQRGAVLLNLAECARVRGDIEAASAALERAEAMNGVALGPALALRRAVLAAEAGSSAAAVADIRTLLAVPDLEELIRCEAELRLGQLLLRTGDDRGAERALAACRKIARRHSAAAFLASAELAMAQIARRRRRFRAADRHLGAAERLFRRAAKADGLRQCLQARAVHALELGNLDACLCHCDELVTQARTARDIDALAQAYTLRADLLRRMGASAAAATDLSALKALQGCLSPGLEQRLDRAVTDLFARLVENR